MKQDKKKKISLGVLIFIVFIVALMIIFTITNLSKPGDALEGTYTYNQNVKYEFNGKGYGKLYENETKYKFTYTLDGSILTIDFKDKNKNDVSYIFDLKNDILTLVNKEDSTNTQYILRKDT